jgi:hypothetical protein
VLAIQYADFGNGHSALGSAVPVKFPQVAHLGSNRHVKEFAASEHEHHAFHVMMSPGFSSSIKSKFVT